MIKQLATRRTRIPFWRNPKRYRELHYYGHQRISQTVKENGETKEYYFTFDGHGSTRVLLNTVGAVAQLYAFDAYGNAIGFNPADALTEFLYSGEQFDSKIGQQYLRARYYDPATGRFNRLDPFFGNVTDPQSFHKYLYTHADPVNGVDPNGLMSLGATLGVTAIIGGITGGIVGSIRGGVEGAVTGAVTGMVLAPIFALGTAGMGLGIAWAFSLNASLGMAISFSIITTAGVGLNAYEIATAENDRDKTAACVSMVFTVGFGSYGAAKIFYMPKLPINLKGKLDGFFPNQKGSAGVWMSEIFAAIRGEYVVAREVPILPNKAPGIPSDKFVIVDLIVKSVFTGKIRFIDSKFGTNAKLTPNQKIGYPLLEKYGGTIKDNRAIEAGYKVGDAIDAVQLQVEHWNSY